MRDRETEPNAPIGDVGVPTGLLLDQMLEQTRMAICVTDPKRDDNPIVYVNRAFEAMTGYSRGDIVGRNCRFLQGRRTDRGTVARLREAIAGEHTVAMEILNYRADGRPFWNSLHVGPIYDAEGRLALFFGSQWDVTDLVAEREAAAQHRVISRELDHRIGNLFTVVTSILRLSRRDGPRGIDTAIDRVLALARAHRFTVGRDGAGARAGAPVDLREMVEAVLEPHAADVEGRLAVVGPEIALDTRAVSSLGLVLHELATNASKHGALSLPEGQIRVSWASRGDDVRIEWDERGGPRVAGAPERRGTGTSLIDAIAQGGGTRIERTWRPEGLLVVLTVPTA